MQLVDEHSSSVEDAIARANKQAERDAEVEAVGGMDGWMDVSAMAVRGTSI